jgi:hypothetical protein
MSVFPKEYYEYLDAKQSYMGLKEQMGGSAYDWYKVCDDNKWVQYSDKDRDVLEDSYRKTDQNIVTSPSLSNGDVVVFDKALMTGLVGTCRIFRNCKSMGDLSPEYMDEKIVQGGGTKKNDKSNKNLDFIKDFWNNVHFPDKADFNWKLWYKQCNTLRILREVIAPRLCAEMNIRLEAIPNPSEFGSASKWWSDLPKRPGKPRTSVRG